MSKHAIEAWDWKLLDSSFESYLSTSMADEQKKAEELSSTLRRQTVTLAVDRAWLALSERMRENRALMQKLQGWAQIAARIGRGMDGMLKRCEPRPGTLCPPARRRFLAGLCRPNGLLPCSTVPGSLTLSCWMKRASLTLCRCRFSSSPTVR